MAALDKAGAPAIKYGSFVNDVISFIILGFVIFMFIKAYNKMKEPDEVAEATEKSCPTCAMKIPVEAKKCGHCGETSL